MIVCICNNITESDLKENPFLINKVGDRCGKCIESGTIRIGEMTYIVDEHDCDTKTGMKNL